MLDKGERRSSRYYDKIWKMRRVEINKKAKKITKISLSILTLIIFEILPILSIFLQKNYIL